MKRVEKDLLEASGKWGGWWGEPEKDKENDGESTKRRKTNE